MDGYLNSILPLTLITGSQICHHGRKKRFCKECGGSSLCEHGKIRSKCHDCRGTQYNCPHGKMNLINKKVMLDWKREVDGRKSSYIF